MILEKLRRSSATWTPFKAYQDVYNTALQAWYEEHQPVFAQSTPVVEEIAEILRVSIQTFCINAVYGLYQWKQAVGDFTPYILEMKAEMR